MRIVVLFLIAIQVWSAEKFALRYFYDRNDETLHVSELKWLTVKRAVAIGWIESEKKLQGVTLETNDGGVTWEQRPFKEVPSNVYFLDDSFGWIVTDKGIWQTEEGGRSWKKIESMKGIRAVHFFDSKRGLAAGFPKLLLRTEDGGKKWAKIPEAETPSTRSDHTVYSVFNFINQKMGQVIGYSSRPKSRDTLPPWMEPEEALKNYQRPAALIVLETHDEGKAWKADTVSVFGQIDRVATTPNGLSLAVFHFDDAFQYQSEVFRMGRGKGERVYRQKNDRVTDAVIQRNGRAYIGAIEMNSKLRNIPIPGRVKILRAEAPQYDLWQDVNVDYRAAANRVVLAERPDGSMWAATDSGMVLELIK